MLYGSLWIHCCCSPVVGEHYEGVRSQRVKGWVHTGWVTPRPNLWLTCGGGDSISDPSLRKTVPHSFRGQQRKAASHRHPLDSPFAFVYALFTMWRKWPGQGKITLNSVYKTSPEKVGSSFFKSPPTSYWEQPEIKTATKLYYNPHFIEFKKCSSYTHYDFFISPKTKVHVQRYLKLLSAVYQPLKEIK